MYRSDKAFDGEASDDYCGWSVAASSNRTMVAVGAFRNGVADTRRGHVPVYRFQTSTLQWGMVGSDNDGEAPYDYSGISVAISADGTSVAIGAFFK